MWNETTVRQLAEETVAHLRPFDNWHGITADNIREFLVSPPVPVTVDPDDLETSPRRMWIVLREHGGTEYAIIFDPLKESWGIAEETESGFVLVIGVNTFEEALDGM